MALFIRPQIPTLISSSHADLKSCTPNLSMTPPKQKSWNIYCLPLLLVFNNSTAWRLLLPLCYVSSLIFSIHLLFSLPHVLVPVNIVSSAFAGNPELSIRLTCPKHCNLRLSVFCTNVSVWFSSVLISSLIWLIGIFYFTYFNFWKHEMMIEPRPFLVLDQEEEFY